MTMAATNEQPKLVGRILEEGRVGPLTRTHFVRYAGAGGDFNPIHHDDEFARSAGYPSVFGHGMLTAGLLSDFVVQRFGLHNLRRFSVRYVGQVWPGDVLVFSGHSTAAAEGEDPRCATYELKVERIGPDGQRNTVLTGGATVAGEEA